MKNLIIVVTELMLLSISSCNPFETDNSHIYSVMKDRTEHDFKASPQADDILNHIHIENDIWRGTIFRYTTVSEIDYNQQRELNLQSENEYTGNSYLRKKKVRDFKNEISQLLEHSANSVNQSKSSVFLPLIRELDHLSQMEGSKRELILFSDLKENNSWFSFYNPSDLKSLQNQKEKIVKLFLSQIPQDARIKDVSLIIIYEPLDANDNQEFRLMVDLYQSIFKKLAVPMTVKANL